METKTDLVLDDHTSGSNWFLSMQEEWRALADTDSLQRAVAYVVAVLLNAWFILCKSSALQEKQASLALLVRPGNFEEELDSISLNDATTALLLLVSVVNCIYLFTRRRNYQLLNASSTVILI